MNPQVQARIEELAPIAIKKWGPEALFVKACEEMAELQVQLCKVVGGAPTTQEAIIDEVCDALLMVSRLRLSVGKEAVDARMHYKLDRLQKALAIGWEATVAESSRS